MKKKKKVIDIKDEVTRVDFLHSGSYLLNLVLSGKAKGGGWGRGRIINIVGDGSSGKTLLALELCAYHFYHKQQSKLFPKVKKVNIVYDNKEGVMDFPLERMYGEKFVKETEWIHSETCESFGRGFQRKVKKHEDGESMIYIMDSLDSLDSEAGIKRIDKSIRIDKEEDGTYGTEKAKYFSKSFFSRLCSITRNKDITLVLISQVRQKMNPGFFEEKYYRTCGKSLDFYTHQVLWLQIIKKLKKELKSGRKKVYGNRVLATLKRSKVGKDNRDVTFDTILNYGLDDVGTLVEFLYPSNKSKKKIIRELQHNPNKFDEAIQKVQDIWDMEEKESEPIRERRFGND